MCAEEFFLLIMASAQNNAKEKSPRISNTIMALLTFMYSSVKCLLYELRPTRKIESMMAGPRTQEILPIVRCSCALPVAIRNGCNTSRQSQVISRAPCTCIMFVWLTKLGNWLV